MRIGQLQIGKGDRTLGLTNNQLKIIAMIAMAVDHTGGLLFPDEKWLRMIGRLAFPIFAYMIAEGCRYTRSRGRYLLNLAVMALGCQFVYTVFFESLYMSIFVTFSLSLLLIYSIDLFLRSKHPAALALAIFVLAGTVFLTVALPRMFPKSGFDIDYRLYGVLFPVVIYYLPGVGSRLLGAGFMLAIKYYISGGVHLFGFCTLPLLMLYNGERGKHKLKYLFYLFYPAHLAVIHFVDLLIKMWSKSGG